MMQVTNIDNGNVVIRAGEYGDATFTAGGAETYKAGTILARSGEKMVPFVKGADNATGTPVAVLTVETVASAAGDLAIRPMLTGVVDTGRLVIHADGDASNVDAAVLDGLRGFGIVGQTVTELNHFDNQ